MKAGGTWRHPMPRVCFRAGTRGGWRRTCGCCPWCTNGRDLAYTRSLSASLPAATFTGKKRPVTGSKEPYLVSKVLRLGACVCACVWARALYIWSTALASDITIHHRCVCLCLCPSVCVYYMRLCPSVCVYYTWDTACASETIIHHMYVVYMWYSIISYDII